MKTIIPLVIFICVIALPVKAQNYTWSQQTTPTTNQLNCIQFLNNFEGYSVGWGGTILKTLNGGTDWVAVNSPTTEIIVGLHFVDINTGYICDTGGTVFKTTDGSLSWDMVYDNSLKPCDNIHYNNGRLFILRDNDVLYTDDGGVSWDSTIVGGFSPESMDFVSNSVGFCVGGLGSISKTLDGGITWVTLPNISTSITLWDIYAVTSTKLIVVGSSGAIFQSTDTGLTWNMVPSGVSNHLYTVHFTNATHGIVAGENDAVLETTDGGTTWIATPTGMTNLYIDVYVANQTIAYLCGANGSIYRSPGGVEDIAALEYTGPDTVCVGQPFVFSFTFANVGTGIATNPGFQVLAGGSALFGDTITWVGNLVQGDTVEHFQANAVLNSPGTVSIIIFSTEQFNQANNAIFVDIEVVAPTPTEVTGGGVFCPGDTLTLEASGGNSYYWVSGLDSGADVTSSIQEVTPLLTTQYLVEIQQDYCKVLDTALAELDQNCDTIELIIPAEHYAFSPNNDGVNDFLVLDFLDGTLYPNSVSIFNRWGDRVYYTDNYDNVELYWDGTYGERNSPPGTYFFIAESEETGTVKGWIQLVK
ncbi:MAG: gliding motility-associated C-terminal domain-containing protein [Crocinitomicaceae bacterium]|nr:gliding motility-associated C-terminal domain-containing protein [Crocinitomicaceae bacterium]